VVRVKSYRDVLAEYRWHPEPKSAGSNGEPSTRETVGLLQRRHLVAGEVLYLGKEANELEAVEAGLVHDPDEVTNVYRDETADDHWERVVLPAIKRVTARELAAAAGVSTRTIKRIRNGRQKPSRHNRERLASMARELNHSK